MAEGAHHPEVKDSAMNGTGWDYFTIYTKVDSTLIKDLNFKNTTWKLWVENIEFYLLEFEVEEDFLNKAQKALTTK